MATLATSWTSSFVCRLDRFCPAWLLQGTLARAGAQRAGGRTLRLVQHALRAVLCPECVLAMAMLGWVVPNITCTLHLHLAYP